MEAMGVIEKIEEQTEWVNTFVPVTKPKGQLRICLDPRNLNKSIKHEYFKLPTRDEVTSQMPKYYETRCFKQVLADKA